MSVSPVSGGWDTVVWRVDRAGGASALRLFRAEQVAACEREVAAMRASAQYGLPVPDVEAQGIWEGRPVVLLSWCRGETLSAVLARRPWRVWELGIAYGRLQAAIHAVPPPPLLQHPRLSWIDWGGPADPALAVRLRGVASATNVLLHLDYHPLNVLSDGRDISAVLDWTNARAGDPRADVARTLTILRLAPSQRPSVLETAMRRLLLLSWKCGYEQEAGPLRDMALFYAWAGAAMLNDLAPKIARPGAWLTAEHLVPIRRWMAQWFRRTGVE